MGIDERFREMETKELFAIIDNGIEAALTHKHPFKITIVGNGPLVATGEEPGFYYYLFPSLDTKVRDSRLEERDSRIHINSISYYMDRNSKVNSRNPLHQLFEQDNQKPNPYFGTDLVILDYSYLSDADKFNEKYNAANVLFSRFSENVDIFFVVSDNVKDSEYCHKWKNVYSISESSHLRKGRLGRDIEKLMGLKAKNDKREKQKRNA